jgi:hypothetical protein
MPGNKFWTAAAVAVSLFAISVPAHAQTRTWVSGVGDDMNPCSRTAPCRSFAGAIAKTATNGTINCLDSAGYGSVTITKSMTIDCHETLGSILVGDVAGIVINITDPKDKFRTVRLRNLDISGAGVGSQGITVLSAATVILEDLEITGVLKNAISDTRVGDGALLVANSTMTHNGGAGIGAGATGGTLSVVVDRSHLTANQIGIAAGPGNNVAVDRSVISANVASGVESDGGQLTVDNSEITHNGNGVLMNSGAIRLSNNTIAFNSTGISGVTTSFGVNRISGNGVAGTAPSPAGAATSDLGTQ